MNREIYQYRRQFILGPRFVNRFQGWDKNTITENLFLTSHPELTVTLAKREDNLICLIGYILNPNNPSASDQEIVTSILNAIKNVDDIFSEIAPLCGRFVIITRINGETRMFHDAAGLRQIYYFDHEKEGLWCASQPSIIAEIFGLSQNKELYRDIFHLKLFKNTSEYFFPSNLTLYDQIHHVYPNNYLDLHSKKIARYWPRNKNTTISFNNCIDKSAAILKNVFLSAQNRFKMAFSISGGWDSRILLAACKDIKEELYYFSLAHRDQKGKSHDVELPSKLLPTLGLKHTIIEQDEMDSSFKHHYNNNVTAARQAKGVNAYRIYKHLSLDTAKYVVVNGNVSEIARRSIHRLPRIPSLLQTPKAFTAFGKMSGSGHTYVEFTKWVNSAKSARNFGYDVLDLFQWEQRIGCWAAMTFSEYDIAFESLCPFNCRELLECMLALDFKFRSPPNYIFHTELIKKMWPETLTMPINPKKYSSLDIFLINTRLYDFIRYLYLLYVLPFR